MKNSRRAQGGRKGPSYRTPATFRFRKMVQVRTNRLRQPK